MLDSILRRISDQTESTTTEALRQCSPLNVEDKIELGTGGEMRHVLSANADSDNYFFAN